jgi:hypothetical protein
MRNKGTLFHPGLAALPLGMGETLTTLRLGLPPAQTAAPRQPAGIVCPGALPAPRMRCGHASGALLVNADASPMTAGRRERAFM